MQLRVGETNGASSQAARDHQVPPKGYREMLLRSKALDICLERCTAYDDLTAIQQPFMALLSALGGVEMQDITQLALAILHVAERLPTSNFEDMNDDTRAAMHGALASLKAFIADFQKTSEDAHADLLDLHKRCMRQETRMDMALSFRDLEERSKSFLELVGARFGLDHRPGALLENIKSIETVLSNQVSELERQVSEVKAELEQNRVQEEKEAVERVLPANDKAGSAEVPEGLAPADFIKHCLSVHYKVIQQLLERGRAQAAKIEARNREIQLLKRIGSNSTALPMVQQRLAEDKEEMKGLVDKATMLQSSAESALALASPGEREELKQLRAYISTACQEMVTGPLPMLADLPAVPVMENGRKTKGQGPRRPPAPVANRKPPSAAAAKRPPSQPRAAGGNNNRRPEKPAPAPKTDAQIKEEARLIDRARMQAAKERAQAELHNKGRNRGQASKPSANRGRTGANGAAHSKGAGGPAAQSMNPWEARRQQGAGAASSQQVPNGHAAAGAAKAPAVAAEPAAPTAPPPAQHPVENGATGAV
ncbi:hypothetical protein COCSUDRAFT_62488 [Coccomyxa subellipsoidea C-169]|uniref:Uncharacterized protein n=1 Tax=Coccomyxa subellipsoidea (strain C-169) TaxID=574566 RepID=I0YZY9_COCSC|nr:hypothetical protein COCSUDRAFT_62488 [Coccomyxa subellipsoidea C-169]EIE23958.1 hypothetical protein COCSUDRAFT_62488 [Coccomyxa subellipsoidea C-169]|eukprot:XP_005648502.1 hypothetical protein COCSUDRAFT_62488 [Coccomyxa subellipsoidea C-169]